jgi:hypothetical protein
LIEVEDFGWRRVPTGLNSRVEPFRRVELPEVIDQI